MLVIYRSRRPPRPLITLHRYARQRRMTVLVRTALSSAVRLAELVGLPDVRVEPTR
ncbi:hypothetical protein [Actinoplanes sichuanensis]|uniref:hypothetical protein n=1 Tax=Actinoplanes sichuanensis TaxID=512349 RepID=UPI002955A0E6|nr:hypothetical protein [Actinoplanes sichuanensis]